MRSYLVDFENVKSKGLVGIDKLTEDDHVIIFYSENSDTISFEMHCCVMRAKASVEYMKVRVGGKNALDFQLSTLLGYMVAKEKNSHIFIISNDKGFDRLHDFWANTFDDAPDCMVFRTQNIMSAINFAKKNVSAQLMQNMYDEDDSESFSEQTADEEQAEQTEGITAEIVVTAADDVVNNSESRNIAADGEPKFIVPEQLIEQFRSEQRAERSENTVGGNNARESAHSYEVSEASKVSDISEMSEKCELIRGYMQGITDEKVIAAVADAVAAADSKLELHNMLMKQFDNEHSSMYYNYMKPHYEYLKRTISEIEGNTSHETSRAEEDIKSVKTLNSEPTLQPKPAVSDNTEEDSSSPKKVDAAMKKTLHRLLDDMVTPDEFSGVVAQINQSSTCRQLYINLMQRFRKARGRELYGVIKDEFRVFSGNEPKAKAAAKNTADRRNTEESKSVRAVSAVEDKDFTEKLKASFDGRLAEEEFDMICELAGTCSSTHELYLAVIKRFKKQKGLFIYNHMKKDFGDYLKSQSVVSV